MRKLIGKSVVRTGAGIQYIPRAPDWALAHVPQGMRRCDEDIRIAWCHHDCLLVRAKD